MRHTKAAKRERERLRKLEDQRVRLQSLLKTCEEGLEFVRQWKAILCEPQSSHTVQSVLQRGRF